MPKMKLAIDAKPMATLRPNLSDIAPVNTMATNIPELCMVPTKVLLPSSQPKLNCMENTMMLINKLTKIGGFKTFVVFQ